MYKIKNSLIPSERIMNKIYIIRGKRVMLDRDLAELYQVETRILNQAVKRNTKRFPEDFMFRLNKEEFKNLRSQFVISSWGGIRQAPLAFTEQGVAMLSSVLNSNRAIEVNIQIIRTFTKLRELLATNQTLQQKIIEMEKRYDKSLKEVFTILRVLLNDEETKKKKEFGFNDRKAVKSGRRTTS